MSDRPRVLHLITRLLNGGAEAKTIETVRRLGGYDFTVGHGAAYDAEQVAELRQLGTETVCFSNLRHYNPLTGFKAIFDIARYIKKHEFDIVHTHSTEAGIIGRIAAAIAGRSVVIHTVHGVPFTDDRNRLLEWFLLRAERLVARLTDVIATNADQISAEYLSRGIGSQEQYRTIYSGIDMLEIQRSRPAKDIDPGGLKLLFVGRLVSGKGLEDLLTAVGRLDREQISLLLVGDGPLRRSIESNILDAGLSDTVEMLGYRDDIGSVMTACDLLVHPSYREGTPRVITEAMAVGLPVVATEIAGIPEQIVDGENGFLIQPGDITALSSRLEQLLSNPELRRRFGTEGRNRAERFDVHRMASDVGEMYEELLAVPGEG